MFLPFYQALVMAAIFYILIPVLGAFYVRRSWRRFRALMSGSARFPFLEYGQVHGDMLCASGASTASPDYLGRFRFFGLVEAMEGSHRLWLRGSKDFSGASPVSLPIDMSKVLLYALPGDGESFEEKREREGIEDSDYGEFEDSPERLSWKSLPALSERTKVFVFGSVYRHSGGSEFRGSSRDPVLVLIYEGREDSLLLRATRQGRQANEYWNKLTPLSFLAGMLGMMAILLPMTRGFFLPLVTTLTSITAFLPLCVFLPPGVFFFFLYRSMWKRARSLRAIRDMVRLPCLAFSPGIQAVILPGGENYLRIWRPGPQGMGALPLRGVIPGLRIKDEGMGFSCFGVEDPARPGELRRPCDPFADYAAIPGVPEEYSKRCSRLAHRYTLAAGIALFVSAALNASLLFIALRRLS